ncbi:hypothetical protein DEU56DRAFT_945409 [Suillus clintonianus]|uniref:uncharacterized protein n=1 Tax=Suillus clintonianus TaxID=1904413 RepID=UPI001B86A5CE|nr:uncharacterized protein DEU56DRAFT_945409 [Suillus clintonianus]KAG2138360.1 hypothetical protein DEU56DRAFT_945409 [Suillus clintonianus]
MHHALFLPEITSNIFEFLNPFLSGPEGSHQPNPLRLQDLAAVATTCHALSGPALDVLWDTLVCFGPLLMCMPPSVIEVRVRVVEEVDDDFDYSFQERRIRLTRDPLLSDVLRMLPYGRRIKSIRSPRAKCRWPLPDNFVISSHIINWLFWVYPIELFLPRLTHMLCPDSIMKYKNEDISWAPLSRSNLASLEFYLALDILVESWFSLSTLVDALPQLRRMVFRVYVWERYMHVLYSGVIAPLCLFRNLEHLDLTVGGKVPEGLGPAGLEIVLPRLRKLKLTSNTNFAVGFLIAIQSTMLHTLDLVIKEHIPLTRDQHEHLDHPSHRLFSSLRCLTISSDFYLMVSLIKAIHTSVLDSISLTIAPSRGEKMAQTLISLITSKRGWDSSLRTIIMDRQAPRRFIDDGPRDLRPTHPYFLSIEDLLVFSHLQFMILHDFAMSLNNTLCKKLATGWPDLVEFYCIPALTSIDVPGSLIIIIPALQPPPVAATVDLGSLVTFARHCPQLSHLHLGIPSDTAELPVLDDETLAILSSRPTRSACMRLSVDADPSPANPKEVATFLAEVFPGREIKIVLAESFCRQKLRESFNGWHEVVEWLRRSQPSILEFGPCYRGTEEFGPSPFVAM